MEEYQTLTTCNSLLFGNALVVNGATENTVPSPDRRRDIKTRSRIDTMIEEWKLIRFKQRFWWVFKEVL